MEPIPNPLADLNGDGQVVFADFLIQAANFGQPGDFEDGDIDGDGMVDFQDFLALARQMGTAVVDAPSDWPLSGTPSDIKTIHFDTNIPSGITIDWDVDELHFHKKITGSQQFNSTKGYEPNNGLINLKNDCLLYTSDAADE